MVRRRGRVELVCSGCCLHELFESWMAMVSDNECGFCNNVNCKIVSIGKILFHIAFTCIFLYYVLWPGVTWMQQGGTSVFDNSLMQSTGSAECIMLLGVWNMNQNTQRKTSSPKETVIPVHILEYCLFLRCGFHMFILNYLLYRKYHNVFRISGFCRMQKSLLMATMLFS